MKNKLSWLAGPYVLWMTLVVIVPILLVVVYAFTAMKHYQEASLRGRQQMGLYLASNLGGTAADLLACLALVPLCGYSGFYLASFVSAPASFLLAAGLARAGAKRST